MSKSSESIAPANVIFRLTIILSLLAFWSLAGCSAPDKRRSTPRASTVYSAPSPTPRPQIHVVVGEVAVVNDGKHFVLVDLGSNLYVPDPGTALRVLHNGVVTAQLTTSPEQKPSFIAADVVAGAPEVGDPVER